MLYQTKNPHGGDIYAGDITLDFSANTNPYGTPEGVRQAIRDCLCRLDRYPDPYCRQLTAAIAAFEGVRPEYILCGNGAAELIRSWCAAVRPRLALELAPTFSEYSLALTQAGCRVERYNLCRENLFDPQPDLVDRVERLRPDAVFLCHPNNPTGRLLPAAVLEPLLEVCRRQGTRLFVDECFLDLTGCPDRLKDRLAENPNLFLLKAFTKSYGMAGVRLGYGLSADSDLLAAMARCSQPWNVSTPAQAAGAAAVQETEFLARTLALLDRQRPALRRGLEQLGLWVCPGAANYLLFSGPEGLDTALRREGIGLRSCANFAALGPGWYRTAVRLEQENKQLLAALQRLAERSKQWPAAL